MRVTKLATLAPPRTSSGLLPEARHVVLPKGITASGFPRVRETCRTIGIEFDPWQHGLNRCLLAKSADGLYAADTVAISIARQVGKTFDIGAVIFALCIMDPGTTVIWTAHRFKVSRETFNELRGLAKSPKLAPHIDYEAITTAAGNETIPFRNGSRIVFAARERGAIRGFTKVRILVLDEAQILPESVLADLAPTMNQATNPLIIMMGTPPKPSDPSEVFSNLRSDALGGESEGILYVEFSADQGADPDDLAQLKKANPSVPHRTPLRAIKRLRKLLSDDDFLREVFGIWDPKASGTPIDYQKWRSLCDPTSTVERPDAFGIDVSRDLLSAAIGLAGRRSDGLMHVEVVAPDRERPEFRPRGMSWVAARCAQLNEDNPSVFVVDKASPAFALLGDLEALGLRVHVTNTAQCTTACAGFVDDVNELNLRHGPQPELDDAVKAARKRELGDGAFAFGRKASAASIAELNAVALARWGAVALVADLSPINNVW